MGAYVWGAGYSRATVQLAATKRWTSCPFLPSLSMTYSTETFVHTQKNPTNFSTWGAKHRYNTLNKIHWAGAQVCQFSLSSYKYLYPLLNEEKKNKDMERKCKLEVVQSLKVPGRAHLWLCGESPCRRVFANGWWPQESTMAIADVLIWA